MIPPPKVSARLPNPSGMSHTQGTPFFSKPPSPASKRLRRVQPCSQQNWPKISARAVVDFLRTAEAWSNLTVSHEWRDECVHAAVVTSMIVKPPHREKLKPPVLVSPWVTTQLQPNAQEWNDSTKQLRLTQVLSLRHTSVLSRICLSIHLLAGTPCLFYRMFLLNADLSFQVPRYWAGRMQRRHSSTLATALQASVLAQWYEWQLRLAVWGLLDCIL